MSDKPEDTEKAPSDPTAEIAVAAPTDPVAAQSGTVISSRPLTPRTPDRMLALHTSVHVGVLPDPGTLQQYQQIDPKVLSWILSTADSERQHRHAMEKVVAENSTTIIKTREYRIKNGLWVGLVTAAVGSVGMVIAAIFKAPLYSMLSLSVALLGCVGVLARFEGQPTVPPKTPQVPKLESGKDVAQKTQGKAAG